MWESKFWRIVVLSVCAAAFAAVIRIFLFGLYVVPTDSMAPTLLTGDYIVANKAIYGYGASGTFDGLIPVAGRLGGNPPRRGDVVVFKSPRDNHTLLVKRLIGFPGDVVQMQRSELYVNGVKVKREQLPAPIVFPGDDEPNEDYVDYLEYLPGDDGPHVVRLIRGMEDEQTINNTPAFTVPPHCYFFMGDNRDRSDDSRSAGFVPEGNLVGRASVTFFSMATEAHIWEFGKWSWAVRWPRLFMRVI